MEAIGEASLFVLDYWVFLDPESPPQIVQIKSGDFDVRIYPPFRNKPIKSLSDDLSVDPSKIPTPSGDRLDRTKIRLTPAPIALPSFSIHPANLIWAPNLDGGFPELPPPERLPRDCVRIDVAGCKDGRGRMAFQIFQDLMQHLRWRSGQWWITRSSTAVMRTERLIFPVNASGNAASTNAFSLFEVRIHALGSDARLISTAIWDEAVMGVQQNREVPLHEILLLDASYFHAAHDLRQSVLQAETAVEHIKERVFQRKWESQNPTRIYVRDKTLRGWNLASHLDEVFDNHFRRSYKREHPTEWDSLKRLYLTRNNVAHGGLLEFGTPPKKVDQEISREFLLASRHCVSWLLGL